MTFNEGGDKVKGLSAFKQAQVRHRRQGAAPNRMDDLDSSLDFSRPTQDNRIYSVKCPHSQDNDNRFYDGPLYGITDFPGFLYAPQALAPSLQSDLAFSAVSEYCESPHATNIDLVPPKAGKKDNNVNQSMWELWKEQNGYGDASEASDGKTNGHSLKKYGTFTKLSWSTMGYQYDWTARAYHEGAKSSVPLLLEELASLLATTALTISASRSTKFTSSACIVNYYNQRSIMGGHRDDLELALDKPVISLSLGLPAVFLLGGKTKEDVPVLPILVRTGDVIILGGESRLNYHGMARVLPAAVVLPEVSMKLVSPRPFQLTQESVLSWRDCCGDKSRRPATVSNSDHAALTDYLSKHRININVRQVLPDDMDVIPVLPDQYQD